MTITVKKAGAYVAPVGVFVKKAGIYAAVQGAFVKVSGIYQSVLGAAPTPTASAKFNVATNSQYIGAL
jgi:hypothetical protein